MPVTDYEFVPKEVGNYRDAFIHSHVFLGYPAQPVPKEYALCDALKLLGRAAEEPTEGYRADEGTGAKDRDNQFGSSIRGHRGVTHVSWWKRWWWVEGRVRQKAQGRFVS